MIDVEVKSDARRVTKRDIYGVEKSLRKKESEWLERERE